MKAHSPSNYDSIGTLLRKSRAGVPPAWTAARNEAISRIMAQRVVVAKSDGKKATFEHLKKHFPMRHPQRDLRLYILQWACSSTTARWELTKSTETEVQAKVSATVIDPPDDLLTRFKSDHFIELVEAWAGVAIDSATRTRVESHRADLAKLEAIKLGPLHKPLLPEGYKTSDFHAKEPLPRTGRDAGAWIRAEIMMPEYASKTTGAPNKTLLKEGMDEGNIFRFDNRAIQICLGCGEGRDVNEFETDHQQALSEIRDKLHLTAWVMSHNQAFKDLVLKDTPNFDVLFIEDGTEFHATETALKVYSNDIGNLMRICRQCNGATGKSDMYFLDWYQKNRFFGPSFLEKHLPVNASNQGLARTKSGVGWGEAARNWFYTHHLPFMVNTFAVSQLQYLATKLTSSSSQRTMDAKYEVDAGKKRNLLEEAEEKGALGALVSGASAVMVKYISSSAQKRLRRNSVESLVTGLEDSLKRRDERRKERDALDSLAFQQGRIAGFGGHAFDDSAQSTSEDQKLYRAGYEAGDASANASLSSGCHEAFKLERGTGVPEGDWWYVAGFFDGARQRADVLHSGYQDGRVGMLLNLKLIREMLDQYPTGEQAITELALTNDYIEGYNRGLKERASTPSADAEAEAEAEADYSNVPQAPAKPL